MLGVCGGFLLFSKGFNAVSYLSLIHILETGVIQLDKESGRLFDTVAQAMSGIVYAAEKKEIAVSVDCPEAVSYTHLDVYKRQQ